MPSMRSDAPDRVSSITQAAAKMIVSPKLGCCISSKATSPVTIPESGTTGRLVVLVLERQQPGDADDEQRLQEFGRLELGEADADPAPRAVHLDADRSAPGRAGR